MWTKVGRLPLRLLAVLVALSPVSMAYDNLDRLVDEFLVLNPGTRQWLRTAVTTRGRPAGGRTSRFVSLPSADALGSMLLGSAADAEPAEQAASLVQRLSTMDRLECVPRLLCAAVAGALERSPPSTPPPPGGPGGGLRPGQQRPFHVFNPAAPPTAGPGQRRRGAAGRRPRRHREKRFTQTVNSYLSVLDRMVRPYSFYPYSHAVLMGGMTESRERCARLYSRCPTDRDGLLNVVNNMNRYFPGGLQTFMADVLPDLEMPSLDALLPGGR